MFVKLLNFETLGKRSILGAIWSKKCPQSQYSSKYGYNTGHFLTLLTGNLKEFLYIMGDIWRANIISITIWHFFSIIFCVFTLEIPNCTNNKWYFIDFFCLMCVFKNMNSVFLPPLFLRLNFACIVHTISPNISGYFIDFFAR